MKVILDECLPRRLIRDIPDHDVTTVPRHGLAGVSNGELLTQIERDFDVFVTLDANLEYQQNLQSRQLGIIIQHAVSSRYESLCSLVEDLNAAIDSLKPGDVVRVGSST